ncbi:MAG: hypothetical protein QME94_00865, partial [Anaerolineae bacterium]|nr:hypothetical protein [Anaerolineae bacterium]
MSRPALRPLFLVIGLPLVVAAWAYTSCPLAATVVDAETGQPLAGARLFAGGQEAQGDGQGGFRVFGLSP